MIKKEKLKFCKVIGNKKLRNYIYVSVHSLCHEAQKCILFPLIILDMLLQLNASPAVVTPVDWTWFEKVRAVADSAQNERAKPLAEQCLRADGTQVSGICS